MRAPRVLFILLFCLCGLATVAAQDQPAAAARGGVQGLVLDGSGGVRRGVAVRIRPENEDDPTLLAISEMDGRYVFADVRPGNYVVDVVGDQHPPKGQAIQVTAGQTLTHHVVTAAGSLWISGLVALSILLYASALLAFRHHNIVHTNRELLRAQLSNIGTRIPLESDPERRAEAEELKRRVEEIADSFLSDLPWREWFFWSRGREIGAWSRLHEVERQLVAFLVPEARVLERAVTAEADLRRVTGSASAAALADRMRLTLQQILSQPNPHPIDPHVMEHLKQQLAEALTILYGESDKKFSALMEWTNKAMWLVYLSLLVIAVVGLVFHHEELFLVGAAGGLMSRMARSLFREDVPSDYGASWTTLFLSPLLGAISAWFGIALIMWLVEMDVLDNELFGSIDWNAGMDAILIGTAFALGFSERLFTSLLSAVEGKVTTALTSASTPAATPPPITPSVGGGTTAAAAAVAGGAPAPTRTAQIVRELDLQHGERAAFLGDPTSPTRVQMVEILGADQVFDVTVDTIADKAPLDGVLFESPPDVPGLMTAAAQLQDALRPDGRLIVVGHTPAALFESDAEAQRAQDHVGPALAKDVLTTIAGLSAQEPPVVLGGTDPLEWLATFVKPVPGGSDR